MTRSAATPVKKHRWLLWFIAAPVLVLLSGASIAHAQIEAQLAKAIAAADRENANWRINDILAHRARVPDAENGAIVVAKVVKLLPRNWPSAAPSSPDVPNPPVPLSMQAYDGLSAAAVAVRLPDDLAVEVRLTLVEKADAVKLARSLVNYPRGRHEVTLGPAIFDTLLTQTQDARAVARLLRMDAMLRAYDDDLDGALESCRAILNVGRSIGDEPFLISMLVRVAIGQEAIDTAKRILALGEPSDDAIVKLQALIDDEAAQPLLTIAINGERGSTDEVMRRLGAGTISLADVTGGNLNIPAARPGAEGNLWYDLERAVMLEWMNDAVAISRKPLQDQREEWNRWDQGIVDARKPLLGKFTVTLPPLLAPALMASSTAFIRYQAMLRSTSLLLSAERHRRKTGAWPESTDKLDPACLVRSPIDPYDGKPIRVKARDGQLFVYCVGFNRQDDGGLYDPKRDFLGGLVDVGTNAWDVALRGQAPPAPKDLPKPAPQEKP